MVYHPYFRGKQFELLAIRETAPLLHEVGFTPIIEPVKQPLQVLKKTLDAVIEGGGSVIVIVNPQIGEHSANREKLFELLSGEYAADAGVVPGLLLTEDMTVANVTAFSAQFATKQVTLIHHGFSDGKGLAANLAIYENVDRHGFIEQQAGRLYRGHFVDAPNRVLIGDGFRYRTANREYPDNEFFSDLHITYSQDGSVGFGDFLMVGDRFVEGGGPAYAIAIHITYIDPENDNAMFIRHFKSDSQTTPTNPAGKFAEAVAKLVAAADEPNSKIFPSTAIGEFRDFHNSRHYPGLGYVKKLSMKHHIETLANFLE